MILMTPMTRRNGVKLNYNLTTGFCSYKIFELLSTFSKKITFKVCFLNCFRHYQKKITFKVCFCWHKEKNAWEVSINDQRLTSPKPHTVSLLTCLTEWVCWEYCREAPRCPWRMWELRWSRTSTSFYQRHWQGLGHHRWWISMLAIK